ncbi:coagulation factor XI [Drosophila ficusphila]|uniref:coagulation factor XI n=1 Tax=Drosophila ficusphila TaxID=30025 RepID=UPI0007E652B6|nr:coagulation factor XI [Drosophila ficusphila]
MSSLQLVIVVLLVALIKSGLGQLPRNGCSPRFEYQGYNGQYIGIVTVRHPLVTDHSLILEFSQPGYHQFTDYVGRVSLVEDDTTTQENLRQGNPIQYRVDFPIPTVPPKITNMVLNNKELCGGSVYPKPRTAITLTITWTTSHSSVYGAVPQPVSPSPIWQQAEEPQNATNNYRQNFPNQPRLTENNVDIDWGNGSFSNSEIGTQPQTNRRVNQPAKTNRDRNTATQQSSVNANRATVPQQSSVNANRVTLPQQSNFARNSVPQQTGSSNGIPCGRERASITPFIFHGTSLQRGQLPWLVAIFERRESNGPAFICGGSLISTSTVLSAAHCFRFPGRNLPASRTAVSLGRNSLAIHSPGEFRGVSELIIHNNYQIKQFTEADLALVRLDLPVRYNDYIVPICLWSTTNRLDLPQGLKSYVAGWGPDETGTGNSDVSKITDMNIVTESNCGQELPHVLVQPSTLCAKKTGAGPCASDGGGPLMLREQEVWVLRGVISGGVINEKENTCELSKPSVFTDVAKHIDWVRQHMWN